MKSLPVVALLALALPAHAETAVTAGGVTLHSVTVDLPGSDRELPPGPAMELVTNNCTACHSPGMMLTQPKLSAKTWGEEVKKMQVTYKAPIADEDVPAIVAYLAALTPKP